MSYYDSWFLQFENKLLEHILQTAHELTKIPV